MIIVRNERVIKINTQIGRYAGIIAILILAGGMYISIKYPEQFIYSLIALLAGIILSQLGIFYSNRFGREPRLDQQIDNSLKGLDDNYALYHFTTAVTHLLVGPAGVWIIFPYHQKGVISYDEKRGRWKRKGGNFYMNLFGQDNIGNPTREMKSEVKRLEIDLRKIPEFEIPEIKTALIFTHPEVVIDADKAPSPTLHSGQFKKLIRKEAKGDQSLPTHIVKTIQDYYGLNQT
jgi:hypothetical protein